MNYREKYEKYKAKYVNLKRDTGAYKFVNIMDGLDKQTLFIIDNMRRITDLLTTNCFVSNYYKILRDKQQAMDVYAQHRINIVKYVTAALRNKWFLVLDDADKIIACAYITPYSFVRADPDKIKTYTITKFDSGFESVDIDYGIDAFCSDTDYPDAGQFLLKSIIDVSHGRRLYVIAESLIQRDALFTFSDSTELNRCLVSPDYLNESRKMVSYYENMGFKLDPELYMSDVCTHSRDKGTEVIFMNVLYFDA